MERQKFKCGYCGAIVKEGIKKCHKCGKMFNKKTEKDKSIHKPKKDPRKTLKILVWLLIVVVYLILLCRNTKTSSFFSLSFFVLLIFIIIHLIPRIRCRNKTEEWKRHQAVKSGYIAGIGTMIVVPLIFVLATLAKGFALSLTVYLSLFFVYGLFLIYYSQKCRRFERKHGGKNKN